MNKRQKDEDQNLLNASLIYGSGFTAAPLNGSNGLFYPTRLLDRVDDRHRPQQ